MKKSLTSPLKNTIETAVYYGFFLLLVGLSIYSSFFVKPLPDPNNLNNATLQQVIFGFAFNRLRLIPTGVLIVAGLAILIGMAALWSNRRDQALYRFLASANDRFFSNKIYPIALCLAFFAACCLLQSNMVSADMVIYKSWIPKQAMRGMMHVRFDEMWESNLHFNAYILLHYFFGTDVLASYRLLSCLAAPFFLHILLTFSRRLVPDKALQLSLFIMSGGFAQLFFGDMEYYTISITLVIAYFYLAYAYLQGETSFITPAMLLALAMTFHMETLYLLPTLFYLSIIGVQRRKGFEVIAGWLGLILLISMTMIFFVSNGNPLLNMVGTSWGLGRNGNILANFLTNTPLLFISRLNMITLVFPAIWLLLALLTFGRVKMEPFNGFLLTGACIGVPFSLVWVSSIGLYSDWNLFSMPLFPAIVLVGYNLIRHLHFPGKTALVYGMTVFSLLVSYSWIVSNHFIGR
jgi:hypothetical protein